MILADQLKKEKIEKEKEAEKLKEKDKRNNKINNNPPVENDQQNNGQPTTIDQQTNDQSDNEDQQPNDQSDNDDTQEDDLDKNKIFDNNYSSKNLDTLTGINNQRNQHIMNQPKDNAQNFQHKREDEVNQKCKDKKSDKK